MKWVLKLNYVLLIQASLIPARISLGSKFSRSQADSIAIFQTMKQKIVMKVSMRCAKCRSKAMKVAATTQGVSSVSFQGEEKDQMVVIGEEIDSVGLIRSLRKKFASATLMSVEPIKGAGEYIHEHDYPHREKYCNCYCQQYYYHCPPCPCPYGNYLVVHETHPTGCFIM